MKKLMIASMLILYASAGYGTGISHPRAKDYFSNNLRQKIITVDSVIHVVYDGDGNIIERVYEEHIHSKDGLRDTVITHSGVMRCEAYEYSPDGKLVVRQELFPKPNPDEGFPREGTGKLREYALFGETLYEYDSEGRLSVEIHKYPSETYELDPDGNIPAEAFGSDTIRTYYTDSGRTIYTKDKITAETYAYADTDSGYFCTLTTETTYLSGEHAGKIESTTATEECVFDDKGRLIRRGIVRITYPDGGGYILTPLYEYEYDDAGRLIRIGDRIIGPYTELPYMETYYTENGYPYKSKGYVMTAEGTAALHYTETAYYYNGMSVETIPVPQSVSAPDDPRCRVYGISGYAVIESDETVSAGIYSVGGQLVKKCTLTASREQIALPAGLYIITVGNASYKTLVR
ncbi:MAG: hypothetical protein LBP64_04340 [Tannerella sp.]|jgi:hypothetical protein|nr:hypothetical protein [Tannerella sp.]